MAPKQGWYILKKPEKYINSSKSLTSGKGIMFRSSWEERFFLFCDFNNSVIKWSSEPFPINYFYELDQKTHRYFVDLYMEYLDKNGILQKCLVEIKPYKETLPPVLPKKKTSKAMINYEKALAVYIKNQAKWKAARELCEKNGLTFKIITEKELF